MCIFAGISRGIEPLLSITYWGYCRCNLIAKYKYVMKNVVPGYYAFVCHKLKQYFDRFPLTLTSGNFEGKRCLLSLSY